MSVHVCSFKSNVKHSSQSYLPLLKFPLQYFRYLPVYNMSILLPFINNSMDNFTSLSTANNIRTKFIKGEKTKSTDNFFASSEVYPDFESIGITNSILLQRLKYFLSDCNGKNTRPSLVQAATYNAISSTINDIIIGAETGSGKTLSYLLPIIDHILQSKAYIAKNGGNIGYIYTRAIVLAPNKDLLYQIMTMAKALCGEPNIDIGSHFTYYDNHNDIDENLSSIVRLAILPGSLKSLNDFHPFYLSSKDPDKNKPLDIIITTPSSLGSLALHPQNIRLFADVKTLIIDEADMLLGGGYICQFENILRAFRRAKSFRITDNVIQTQKILVAATLPDSGLRNVDKYISKSFPTAKTIVMSTMHNARHHGLMKPTTWIKDSEFEKNIKVKRMERLLVMLRMRKNDDGLKEDKIIVFVNSVQDVEDVTKSLRRENIDAIPYHAKILNLERRKNLYKFRCYVAFSNDQHEDKKPLSVLVCTDLGSRGVDIPGVTAIVELQFAGDVVTHLHRIGRCGRAGKCNGRVVVFYGGKTESILARIIMEKENVYDRFDMYDSRMGEVIEEGGLLNIFGKVNDSFSRKRSFSKKRKKYENMKNN